jgi:hypothetical protein
MLDEDCVLSPGTGPEAEPVSRMRGAMQDLEGSFGRIGGLLQEVLDRADEIAELARSLAPSASEPGELDHVA